MCVAARDEAARDSGGSEARGEEGQREQAPLLTSVMATCTQQIFWNPLGGDEGTDPPYEGGMKSRGEEEQLQVQPTDQNTS